MRRAGVRRLIAAAAGAAALGRTPAAAEEPAYDGFQELLDYEAHAALDHGDYKRAWYFFWRLLVINPNDARALREAGRTAQALGDFVYSERALARVDAMRSGAYDPELHYLRGEALLALARQDEAQRELAEAERELAVAPRDRGAALWLARIYALRGNIAGAEAIYRSWLPIDLASPEHAEIMIYIVEAHMLGDDPRGAERALRLFLAYQPNHPRGREMLAWVLEARGKIDEEVRLRAHLAAEQSKNGGRVVGYARALERANNYPAALHRYRQARELGVDELSPDIARMAHRISPEVSAGAVQREDPSGSVLGLLSAATLPLGARLRLAVSGARETVDDVEPLTLTTGTGWALWTSQSGDVVAAGGALYERSSAGGESEVGRGATAALRTRPGNWQVYASGELGMPWRESASTIREGGWANSVGGDLYATPFGKRIVLELGGRARQLGLAPMAGVDAPTARQLFGSAGVDFVVQSDPTRTARGEILDDDMLWPAPFASSLVLSYRHYEMTADDPFGPRLVLVERSAIDELSGVFRRVLDKDGVLGLELRGGLGYDRARALDQWRAGGAFLLSATSTSRLSLSYDAASESGTGLVGRRHSAWITLHVDL